MVHARVGRPVKSVHRKGLTKLFKVQRRSQLALEKPAYVLENSDATIIRFGYWLQVEVILETADWTLSTVRLELQTLNRSEHEKQLKINSNPHDLGQILGPEMVA